MIIERKRYIQQLLNSRHNGLVKIITGIRITSPTWGYAMRSSTSAK